MIFKKLAKETAWFTVSKIIGIITGLIVIPFMTKYLSPIEVALYSLIIGLQLVFSTIISLQLHQPINVLFFDYKYQKIENLISQSLLTLFIIASLLLGFFLYFTEYFVFLIKSKLFNNLYEVRLGLLLAYLFCFTAFFEYLIRITKNSRFLFKLNFSVSIFSAILKIYFLSMGYGINVLFSIMVLSSIITIGIQIIKFKDYFTPVKFDNKIFSDSVKYSIPLIPYAFLASLSIYTDRYFFERYLSLELLGLYFIAYKFSSLIKFVANQISLSYQPFFYEKAKNSIPDALISAESFGYFQIISVTLIVFSANVFSKEIFEIFLDEKYVGAHLFFLILNCSFFFRVLWNVKSLGLYFLKKTNFIFIISLICFTISVVLNYFLIKYFKINSIPYVVGLSQLISYLIVEFYLDKYMDIKINLQLLIFSILIICLSYIPHVEYLGDTFFSGFLFKFILFAIISFLIFIFYNQSLIHKIKKI